MGTWGPGNFENDYAADQLYEVCGPLLKQIEEAFDNSTMLEPDEDGPLVMANLEIIACLSEHLGCYARGELQDFLYPCVMPPPKTIADWKRRFLEVWDACIDGLAPDPDYKRQRREVILETFQRVERLAAGRYEGKTFPDVRSYIADQVHRGDKDPEADQQATD
jgi:hypothetical protein